MTKAQTPPASQFPFDLGITQAARTLIRTHQLLRGELLKHRDGAEVFVQPDACLQRMAEIEAVLRFFGVDFDPRKLKPRRARPKIGPLGYGEIRAGVLDALKRAGDWQTYNQVADAVLRRHGIELTVPQRKHFVQKLREATHALKKAGAVVCERQLALGDNEVEQRWRLSSMFD